MVAPYYNTAALAVRSTGQQTDVNPFDLFGELAEGLGALAVAVDGVADRLANAEGTQHRMLAQAVVQRLRAEGTDRALQAVDARAAAAGQMAVDNQAAIRRQQNALGQLQRNVNVNRRRAAANGGVIARNGARLDRVEANQAAQARGQAAVRVRLVRDGNRLTEAQNDISGLKAAQERQALQIRLIAAGGTCVALAALSQLPASVNTPYWYGAGKNINLYWKVLDGNLLKKLVAYAAERFSNDPVNFYSDYLPMAEKGVVVLAAGGGGLIAVGGLLPSQPSQPTATRAIGG